MRYIKKYENFQINEELGIVTVLTGIALTALIAMIGTKSFQVYDTLKFKKDFKKVDQEEIKSKYLIKKSDYEKTKEESQSGGLKKLFMALKRNLGLQEKEEMVEEVIKFDVLEDKDGKEHFSIKVNVEDDKGYFSKEILVFDKEQFESLKKKCQSGNFNPMSILTKGKKVEEMKLKTYTPLQVG